MTHLFRGVDAVLTDAPARPLRAVRLSAVGPLSGLIPARLLRHVLGVFTFSPKLSRKPR